MRQKIITYNRIYFALRSDDNRGDRYLLARIELACVSWLSDFVQEVRMSLTVLGDLTRRLDQRSACALIAIKERSRCKTRLSEALAPLARAELARSMLAAVLSAAEAAQTVRQIIVVSPERDSIPAQIPVLADTGECLNSALAQAHRVLRGFGAREGVFLPADLPTVSAADIDTLVRAGRRGGCALAPDTAGSGTKAPCLGSAPPFRFAFG